MCDTSSCNIFPFKLFSQNFFSVWQVDGIARGVKLWHLTCNILYNLVWKASCTLVRDRIKPRGRRGDFSGAVRRTVKGIEPSKPLARESFELLRPTAETPGVWGWQMAAIGPVLSGTSSRWNRPGTYFKKEWEIKYRGTSECHRDDD